MAGVVAEQPQPQPVVVAVLHDPQVGRRGDHQPGPLRQAAGAQGSRNRTPASRASPSRAIPRAAGSGWRYRRRSLSSRSAKVSRSGEWKSGPRHEVADVARRHAERVGHDRRQVARALAVEDAGQGRKDETVGAIVGVQAGPQVEQLGERSRVEGERDLGRYRRVRPDREGAGVIVRSTRRPRARTGGGGDRSTARPRGHDVGRAWVRHYGFGEGVPLGCRGGPGQTERSDASLDVRFRGRVDLGRGQDLGERVEVVAGADSALGARLKRCSPAAAERVQHHVARAGVSGDEGMNQAGREARKVRAHGMEAVAPETLLILPFRRDGQMGQLAREFKGELAVGRRETVARPSQSGWSRVGRRRQVGPIELERERCHVEGLRRARPAAGR
jgi:hypothetical protein